LFHLSPIPYQEFCDPFFLFISCLIRDRLLFRCRQSTHSDHAITHVACSSVQSIALPLFLFIPRTCASRWSSFLPSQSHPAVFPFDELRMCSFTPHLPNPPHPPPQQPIPVPDIPFHGPEHASFLFLYFGLQDACCACSGI
jgi:hypothetical protein